MHSQQSDSPTAQRARAKRRQGQRPLPEERDETKELFLAALAEDGIVRYAAERAGIHRSTAYEWRTKDPNFKKRFDLAFEDSSDLLERALWNRAIYGVAKPLVSGGHVVYREEVYRDKNGEIVLHNGKPVMIPVEPIIVYEFSDRLGEVLLKGRRPEYRERQQVEVSGPNGGPIQQTSITFEDLQKLDEKIPTKLEDWKRQRGFLGRGKEALG